MPLSTKSIKMELRAPTYIKNGTDSKITTLAPNFQYPMHCECC